MTAAAAPTGSPRPVAGRTGRSGSVTWMVLPALAIFTLFGLLPLVGVLVLSFTRWDGLGAIHGAGASNWVKVLGEPELLHALWVTFLVMFLSWAVQTRRAC